MFTFTFEPRQHGRDQAKRLSIALSLVIAASLFACEKPPRRSTGFPNKPVRLLVPYGPGGATDIAARIIAEQVRTSLDQAIIVENKPGGGGIVALEEVVGSKPDGYTLVL